MTTKNENALLPKEGRSFIPFAIAVITFFVLVMLIVFSVYRQTGTVMYPLDDPFIHMKIAKNLALHNTWGINPHEFGSASSSLLYTLLLAIIFKIFSVNVIVPLIVNCIAAVILLYVIDKWLEAQTIRSNGRTLILLLIIFLTPLPVLAISGMEHVLQCLFSFLFLTQFATWVSAMRNEIKGAKWRLPIPVIVYGLLTVATRYEGLFLVFIACLILLYFRKLSVAFQLGIIALLPVLIFGAYSISKGSYFLPNSVLVKSETMHLSLRGIISFFQNIFINKLTITKAPVVPVPGTPPPGISLLTTQRLLLILPLTYLFFNNKLKNKSSLGYLLAMLIFAVLLHLSLAATGWFYRYEAYLILCSVALVSAIAFKYGKELLANSTVLVRVAAVVVAFFLFFPAILRTAAAFTNARQACVNIYQQQYQMAQFVKQHYNRDTIAANDIGAVSFYSDSKMIDLWGLGNIDIARSKKGNYNTPAFLDSLVKRNGVKIAMVYDEWFDSTLLKNWTRVATWQIYNNVICGGDVVSFYAIKSTDAADLSNKLHQYQAAMPTAIKLEYMQ